MLPPGEVNVTLISFVVYVFPFASHLYEAGRVPPEITGLNSTGMPVSTGFWEDVILTEGSEFTVCIIDELTV